MKKQKVNLKKVYRVYSGLNLKYRIKSSIKRYCGEKKAMMSPVGMDEGWSMHFVRDSFYDGRKFRVFNLLEVYTKESIMQHVDFSISGLRLVRIFDDLKKMRKLPVQLVCDNGTEFTSKAFIKWALDNNVDLYFIDKDKST